MREIKYRVWEETTLPNGRRRRRMISTEELLSYAEIPSPMLPSGFHDDIRPGEVWVWMQYTGLKDRNGREIYEGDIVKGNSGSLFQVRWDNDLAAFTTINLCAENWEEKMASGWHKAEVIGNIYEKGVQHD